jgi:hypothetical protein
VAGKNGTPVFLISGLLSAPHHERHPRGHHRSGQPQVRHGDRAVPDPGRVPNLHPGAVTFAARPSGSAARRSARTSPRTATTARRASGAFPMRSARRTLHNGQTRTPPVKDPFLTGETMAHDGKGGLGLLVHQVRGGELDREGFLRAAQQAGVTEEQAAVLADAALAARENQRRPREQPREGHDFIVIGSGSIRCWCSRPEVLATHPADITSAAFALHQENKDTQQESNLESRHFTQLDRQHGPACSLSGANGGWPARPG